MSDAAEFVARLIFAGPMIYIGLCMATDPRGSLNMLFELARVLETFEQRFHQLQLRRSSFRREPVSERQAIHVRFAGAALITLTIAFLVLAGR